MELLPKRLLAGLLLVGDEIDMEGVVSDTLTLFILWLLKVNSQGLEHLTWHTLCVNSFSCTIVQISLVRRDRPTSMEQRMHVVEACHPRIESI